MLIKYFIYIYQLKITYKKLLKLAAALQLLLHKKDGLTSKEKTKTKQQQNKNKTKCSMINNNKKGGNWRKFDILVNLIVWEGEDC